MAQSYPSRDQSGAYFENVAIYRVWPNPIQTLGFQGYGLGFASGKWAPGPWAGQWEIPFYAGRVEGGAPHPSLE